MGVQRGNAPSGRRLLRRLALAFGSAVLLVGGAGALAVGWHYLRTPPLEAASLPGHMISLRTAQGQRLLAESEARADYPGLAANFVSQSRRSYCGVASAVTTLNALRPGHARLDQATFFSAADFPRLAPFKLSFTGMSLRQFGEALRAHGAHVTVTHASDSEMAAFRALARRSLQSQGDVLLVNYQRAALGQERSGHISPIAAYHAPTDSLLILDVAAHKYPPAWVSVDALWQAMQQPLNPKTSRTRGFVVVRASPQSSPNSLPLRGAPGNCASSDCR
jgi:hypothetical protein